MILIAWAGAFACASCGTGLLGTLERSIDDPTIAEPTVVSFAKENQIDVSWAADTRADEYILEAASGSDSSPSYSVVYQGTATQYEETNCVDQSLHLYRLTKTRGSKQFGPSQAALGVGSAVTTDAQEPNDDEASATDLGYEKDANLYYYRSYGGLELEDADWYSITIPPRMVARVVVVQTNPTITGNSDTWMYYYQKGILASPIFNDLPIEINNFAYSTQTITFKIYPRTEYFMGAGGAAGGSMINYSVKLYSMSSL
jgi:hypothetical protein